MIYKNNDYRAIIACEKARLRYDEGPDINVQYDYSDCEEYEDYFYSTERREY